MTSIENAGSNRKLSATRIIVSTVGILCGISGIEHGFFETLQSSTAPSELLISAIGPANRFWPGGTETALTIVPNFLITGLLAMLAGLLVIFWSVVFVQKKYGSAVFFLLKEYIMCLAEKPGFRHIHVHVIPKPADLPEELTGTRIFAQIAVTPEQAIPAGEIDALCKGLVLHGYGVIASKLVHGYLQFSSMSFKNTSTI